jgi:hypothetical protein
MESLDGNNFVSCIELQEDEQIKYNLSQVSMTIKGDRDEVALTNGSLILTTSRVIYSQTFPRKVCLTFRYQNCITYGINKQDLVCTISDLQDHHDDDEDDDDEEDENGFEKEREPDYILERLKTVDSFEFEDWVRLIGEYQVLFHYSDMGAEKLNEVFNVFCECSALNPDDNEEEDQAEMLNNDFITANDIDDEGKIKPKMNDNFEVEEEFDAEDGGYEDDDEGFEQELANQIQGTKKTKGENMNVE